MLVSSVGDQSGWANLPLPALACSVPSLRSFGKISRSILVEGWPSVSWFCLCLHSGLSCSLNLHTVGDSKRVFFYLQGLQRNDLAKVGLECGHLVIRVQHSMFHHPESEGFSGGIPNWKSSLDKPFLRSSRMLHIHPSRLHHRIVWLTQPPQCPLQVWVQSLFQYWGHRAGVRDVPDIN
jgi:hypothetical protein